MTSRPALQRLLLYSHDTYGLGHLRRNMLIAQDLLEHLRGLQVVLLSGSPVAERFERPRGLSIVALPPVVKTGVDEYGARDGRLSFSIVRRARAAIIADVARRFEPDVFLVDHAPQGMKGELLPTFETLRRFSPATRIVLGLRDIVDDPLVVRRAWTEQGVLATLAAVYDRIAVYGSRDLVDVRPYGIPSAALDRVTYCGYLGRPRDRAGTATFSAGQPTDDFVLGAAGGGGDGAEVLLATLRAAEGLDLSSLLVSGTLMGADERQALEAAVAASRRGHLAEFVPGLEGLMRAARVVVTMGGYNSTLEAVASGTPTIVVPRMWPRREQYLRARLFASHGLLRTVDPGPGLDARLARTLREALAGPRAAGGALDAEGLARLRDMLLVEAQAAQRDRIHAFTRDAVDDDLRVAVSA